MIACCDRDLTTPPGRSSHHWTLQLKETSTSGVQIDSLLFLPFSLWGHINLPFLLPENKICLLGLVPPSPGGVSQVLACPPSSHWNLSGRLQAASLPSLAPAGKGTQLALHTPAGCAQVAVGKIGFDLICKLSPVIETE